MKRIYQSFVHQHFSTNSQMLFLVGPRQVGKTTIAKECQNSYSESLYMNWDVVNDREKILSGQDFIEEIFPLAVLRESKPLIIFDEIHKFKNWKNYLKGFYDLYNKHYHILVTGSSRLDVLKSGGDSLMGRYFQYRIHPLSISEIVRPQRDDSLTVPPKKIDTHHSEALLDFGGFPDPFLKASPQFSLKWNRLRSKQLLYEDIQQLSQIHELSQLEVLTVLLKEQTGQILNRSSLSKKIQVTVQTVSRWVQVLETFYFCFQIKPWSKNITRSLIKEPKLYLWDWSEIEDEGARFENFVACHLLKAVHFWTDIGLGNFQLFFLRDKDKREIDFLVTQNQKPWILVEAKNGSKNLSKSLLHFQNETKSQHIFQVTNNLPYVNRDCFESSTPLVVPAQTFLSQLV